MIQRLLLRGRGRSVDDVVFGFYDTSTYFGSSFFLLFVGKPQRDSVPILFALSYLSPAADKCSS